jgi:hemerythrin-like domain-containing protein
MAMLLSTRRNLIAVGAMTAMAGGCSAEVEEEVGAMEDLMREHGVLRRILLVFAESIPRLRGGNLPDAAALNRAARLFRDFGEDYHEQKLEEAYIFPRLRRGGGPAAASVNTLLAQHRRGREVTDFVLSATGGSAIAGANAEPLAQAFQAFALMYENHAAREDTIIFPAWKKLLSEDELHEQGEKFEEIEKAQFGGDGFDKAVAEIGEIEQQLGFSDLAQFTAPAPVR